VSFGVRRLLVALADVSPAFADTPVPVEEGFWRRLLIALADASPTFTSGPMMAGGKQTSPGKRAVVQGESAGQRASSPGWRSLADQPGALRLPRFDRTAVRTARTESARRQRQETVISATRYVQRDAGRDRLEIMVESARVESGSEVLPVTVASPERTADYFLVFRPEESGSWVAAVYVPGIRDWADVFVHPVRDRASLGTDDSDVVERSVRAAPDPWIPQWQKVAVEREAEDPVRQAIERALRA
jgi:hypothetical protein